MNDFLKHKNSQKRVFLENEVYFITNNTFNNYPYFKEEILCDLWIKELNLCKNLKKFELYAFCLNYNHFHLLFKPSEEFDVSEILRSFKTNYSRNVNRIIENENYTLPQAKLDDLAFLQARSRDLAYKESDNLTYKKLYNLTYLEKYNKFLQNLKNQFQKKHKNESFPKFQWQKSFHDHIIRNQDDFEKHWNYTTYNFQKHNMPSDWEYTSLNFLKIIDNFQH